MRVFILLLAVFSSTTFAKIENNACEQSIVNYGRGRSNVTQVGRFEIQYKDGTLELSEYFVAEGLLGRVSEKDINAYIASLQPSRDRIDHVTLHLYFPQTDGRVSQIIKLKD
jgi:hypothetical protein